MYDQEARLKAARKQVKKLKEFYSHLSAYVIVNAGLGLMAFGSIVLGIDWLMGVSLVGFLGSLFGWGIGLAFHAWEVYGDRVFGRDWEERKIAELLNEAPPKRKNQPEYFTQDDS
jgi:hypothetical protein